MLMVGSLHLQQLVSFLWPHGQALLHIMTACKLLVSYHESKLARVAIQAFLPQYINVSSQMKGSDIAAIMKPSFFSFTMLEVLLTLCR
jgi:hypothetical protein